MNTAYQYILKVVSNRKHLGTLARVGLISLVVCTVFLLGALEKVERWALNTEFQVRGAISPQSPVVIVSINEDSFDELEFQWPWPRSLHAQFLDTLRSGHPAVIGFDILFSEPSALGPGDDEAFAEAIQRAGNVVLAAALSVVEGDFYRKENLNPPISMIRQHIAGYGPVNLTLENDAFVRRAQLHVPYQDKVLKSFDLLIHEIFSKTHPSNFSYDNPHFFINFRGGPQTFETIPYYRVLNREIPPEYFHNKIVLIGAASPLLHDVYPTPFASRGEMPGVEIHANILETMIQGIPITRVHQAVPVALIACAAFLALWITNKIRPLRALGILAGLSAFYGLIVFGLFTQWRLWVDLVPLPLTLLIGYGSSVVENFIREQREKHRLSHYFSPSVLADITRHRNETTLGSSRRIVTILFSDIRGFTTMTEKMEAEDVVTFLREYLTEMTDAVFQHGGTVDKYIGDAIMALYNVPIDQPNHALQAVKTALEIQRRIKPLAKKFKDTYGGDLACGVGIHTGEAVVGTMGSAQRFEYTAIGDTINLGSRLENITKEYRTPIVISESTYQQVKSECLTRYLDKVKVKGKEIPVKIYAALEESTRAAIRKEIKGEVAMGVNGCVWKGAIHNISNTGIAVLLEPPPANKGDVAQLHIHSPALLRPLTLQGTIVWTGNTLAGLAFVNPPLEDQHIIQGAILP